MSGKRTKQLRKQALAEGTDIHTVCIKGQGEPNKFRQIKKKYLEGVKND